MLTTSYTLFIQITNAQTQNGVANASIKLIGADGTSDNRHFRRVQTNEQGVAKIEFTDLDLMEYYDVSHLDSSIPSFYFEISVDGSLVHDTKQSLEWQPPIVGGEVSAELQIPINERDTQFRVYRATPPNQDDDEANPWLLYFCLPHNDKLLGYWDTIADRLFKIRHCQNIEGVTCSLALFQPPIDPALLVKAAAADADLSSALSDLNALLPHYRFSYMLQKANEFVNDVKTLGGALIGAGEERCRRICRHPRGT